MGVTQSQWTWHFCSQHTTSKPKGSETRNPSAMMAVSLGEQRCTTCGLWALKGAGSWPRCHQVTTGRPRTCKSATRQHIDATCLKACFYGRRQKAEGGEISSLLLGLRWWLGWGFRQTPSCCPSYSTPGRGIFGILESLANHCVSPSLLAVKGP